MDDVITLNYHISPDDFTRAGEASSDVKGKLKQMGVSPDAVRKVAIAMYEGEINMVIHAKGGEITVNITPEEIEMILMIAQQRNVGSPVDNIIISGQVRGP